MLRRTSCLSALVLLCGVGRAGEPKPDDARFIGHLRMASVELLGVTQYPANDRSRWWRPDGTSAEIGPYLQQKSNGLGVHVGWGTREEVFFPKRESKALQIPRGQRGVTFLVRLENPPTLQPSDGQGEKDRYTPDTSRPAKYPPTERPSYDRDRYAHFADIGLRPVYMFHPWGPSPEVDHVARGRTGTTSQRKNIFSPQWRSNSVVDADGKVVPNYSTFSAVVADPAQTAVLRVGLSMEAWETVASQKPDSVGSSTFNRFGREWTVAFDKAEALGPDDKTQVKLTTTVCGYNAYNRVTQRLVAVTNDGREHATKGGEGHWQYGRTIAYDLPLSSIKEFRFQVSPYDWVVFRNVSLKPGKKTRVTVVSVGGP